MDDKETTEAPEDASDTEERSDARTAEAADGEAASTEAPIPDPERARVAAPVLLLLGIGLGFVAAWGASQLDWTANDEGAASESTTSDHEHEHAEPVYTCPMHPAVESDRPGACPVCGMDLVLRTSSTGLDPVELARIGRVAMSPVERVLANVATVEVSRADLTTDIRAFGQLVYDETTYATIPAWVGGRVDRLYIEETGTEVERGSRLLSIYSPDLLAAQEEYLVILRGGRASEGLREPAERRLRLLGLSDRQTRRLADRGETSDTVSVYAPAEGTIVERLVQEGEYVVEGQPLFRLAGSQNIWVEAEVFEKDVAFVHEGMQAEVTLVAFPGESFSGIVTLIWPFLEARTRTLRVRIEFESVDPRFRAGMYANVMLSASMVEAALVVPTQAIIRTGQRSAVYVEIDENLFERRNVELGYRSGGLFEVLRGVDVGENVVAQGGFLIDSEAQLYAGGQSLHVHGEPYGPPDSSRETHPMSQTGRAAIEAVPTGHYFCPTDPSEHAVEAGRCSANNIAMIQRTQGLQYGPDADPVSYVQPGEWYCPMGAEWVAEESGRCPICGMFLVEMPRHDQGHEQQAVDDATEQLE